MSENGNKLSKRPTRRISTKGTKSNKSEERREKNLRKRAAREIAQVLLELPLSESQGKLAQYAELVGLSPDDMTQKAAMILAGLLKAQSGDMDAIKFMLGLIDEAPANKTQTQLTGSVSVASVLGELEQRKRNMSMGRVRLNADDSDSCRMIESNEAVKEAVSEMALVSDID